MARRKLTGPTVARSGVHYTASMSVHLIHRPVNWLALAGFMGTGKSRVGWELSRELALHFIDTDKLIQRVTGLTLPQLFEAYGEATFRAYEREVVRRVVRIDHAVVSLGGGTFIHPENRELLLSRGPVVVLWASPETILERTRRSNRPLLQTEDPLGKIHHLLAEREGAYRQGTLHVSSDGREATDVVGDIIEKLWESSDSQLLEFSEADYPPGAALD